MAIWRTVDETGYRRARRGIGPETGRLPGNSGKLRDITGESLTAAAHEGPGMPEGALFTVYMRTACPEPPSTLIDSPVT